VTPQENIRHSIEVLHQNNMGGNNGNAKSIIGIDKNSSEVKYRFDSLADGGRYFATQTHALPSSCKTCIWRALRGMRVTYMGCVWEYDDKDELA
jgi:hypothetical protein